MMQDRKARVWMGELARRTGAPALALLVVGLGVTGCHKKRQVAYVRRPLPVTGAPPTQWGNLSLESARREQWGASPGDDAR